ncbi:GGDEF domain-containing protein [Paraburkholderia sp. SIMBA_049]
MGSLILIFGVVFVMLAIVLASQVSRRWLAESELRALAGTDPLTGLKNRREFNRLIAEACEDQANTGAALLFIDLDRFKSYNDRYGHLAGDRALVTMARCIETAIDGTPSTAARYGGEEFVVVLPAIGEADARKLAESIRQGIWDASLIHSGSEWDRMTASIGVTSWGPGAADGFAQCIHAADAAAYQAKAAGRNCIMTSHGLCCRTGKREKGPLEEQQ